MTIVHHICGSPAASGMWTGVQPFPLGVGFCVVALWLLGPLIAVGLPNASAPAADATASAGKGAAQPTAPAPVVNHFYIREYRVLGGGHLLPNAEVESAVYPYLGPYRTAQDVDEARGALEQAYREKGFQTVTVQVPPQKPVGGVILLQVMSGQVARLRVHGSRYFSIDQIKREAPSLQEGQSPNFSQVTHDLLVLNDISDRRVTPTVRPGEVPGTVDVDLNVKDTLPLHGSVEINNRYSADTDPLRVNASISYDNLWQLEHSVGISIQFSPQDTNQVEVFSGYYLARIPQVDWISFMLQGTNQDSDVNTLGGIGVAGKGQTIGGRAIIVLPGEKGFYHSVSLGIDYKHNTQDQLIAGTDTRTPDTYYPFSAAYSASWAADKIYETDLNASVNLSLRGIGSNENDFEINRHGASGDFIFFRGDLSHTHELPGGFQAFVKAQGQVADQPLLNSEQFSGGGLGTVRGYYESEELGDNGILGTAEMRTPSLSEFLGKSVNEWRFYVFGDGGILTINDPLPEQDAKFKLASVGMGSRIKLVDHINGSLDVGLPLDNATNTNAYETQLTFRLWADF